MPVRRRRGENRSVTEQPPGEPDRSDIAVIGAGFGGLGMGYYLRKAGVDSFVIFEKGADVGGVWRENTYPGAGCDVPSHFYSFSFERRHPWTYRYAKQEEILDYLRGCARRHGLYPHIRFGHEATAAEFDEARGIWRIRFADGRRHEARFLVTAVGQLHRPSLPEIPGRERFRGTAFHSAQWDHDLDLEGKRVAVIGTGASAVQFVPKIAPRVAQLHVFQRSPGWVAPKFEKPFTRIEHRLMNGIPLLKDLDRLRIFLLTEALGFCYRGHKWAEKLVTWMSRAQLRLQVRDPELRARLTPDFPIGCKRILLTTDWLPALARPNVELVTDGIEAITADGVRTADGRERPVDVIIYGTGFMATEFLAPMTVRGVGGREIQDAWRDGAQAYRGVTVAGFPNFFTLYGPNTNLGAGSIVYMLERQQRYIARMWRLLRRRGLRYVDVREGAQQRFNDWLRERSRRSTFEGDCQSWYKNADGVNTNNWVGSQLEYARLLRAPRAAHYRLVANPE